MRFVGGGLRLSANVNETLARDLMAGRDENKPLFFLKRKKNHWDLQSSDFPENSVWYSPFYYHTASSAAFKRCFLRYRVISLSAGRGALRIHWTHQSTGTMKGYWKYFLRKPDFFRIPFVKKKEEKAILFYYYRVEILSQSMITFFPKTNVSLCFQTVQHLCGRTGHNEKSIYFFQTLKPVNMF